jgi:hypothetical protein
MAAAASSRCLFAARCLRASEDQEARD